MAHDMSNVQMVGWTILIVSSLYQLASLVTPFPTKQWIKGVCKMNVGLSKLNPSLPSIHPFWRFFSAPPPSSLQHSRHLPKLLEVFLPRWMTWTTRKRVNLHSKSMVLLITNMESEKICSCLKRYDDLPSSKPSNFCGVSPFQVCSCWGI